MRTFLLALSRNAVSLVGAALTTASALAFLILLAVDLGGRFHGPYNGILAFILVPALFVLGLLLIPIGLALDRRRRQKGRSAAGEAALPVVDLNVPRTRAIVTWFLLLTGVNFGLIALASYKATEVMESTRFCGTTCHTIMQPEYTAHQRSVHAGVPCVACHIGPGGAWFVKAKLSGARQVIEALTKRYSRPIPAPVHVLRSARETCTECHQPARDVGDKPRVIRHRGDEQDNPVQETALRMHIGGKQAEVSKGIHWHADPVVRIRYRSDAKREVIDTVEVTRPDGRVTVYTSKSAAAPVGDEGREWRDMDCVDCHNRIAHPSRSVENEVDEAIDRGRIDAGLPFVRRESVALLKQARGTHEEAARTLAAGLAAYYQKDHPDVAAARGADVAAAGRALGELYARNVFPAMKVSWAAYPDQLGHMDTPGCFRCHDGDHATSDGQAIASDCGTCHSEPS